MNLETGGIPPKGQPDPVVNPTPATGIEQGEPQKTKKIIDALSEQIPTNTGTSGKDLSEVKAVSINALDIPSRKELVNFLGSLLPEGRSLTVKPGEKLSPEDQKAIIDHLKEHPEKFKKLDLLIESHETNIRAEGPIRSLYHKVAKFCGISITGQAEKLRDEVFKNIYVRELKIPFTWAGMYMDSKVYAGYKPQGAYTGFVKNDKPHGEGVFEAKIGYWKGLFMHKVMIGEFSKGEFVSGKKIEYETHEPMFLFDSKPSYLYDSNTYQFEGNFTGYLLQGIGTKTTTHNDGTKTKITANFEKGVPIGAGSLTDKNGITYQVNFKDGEATRLGIVKDSSGTITLYDIDDSYRYPEIKRLGVYDGAVNEEGWPHGEGKYTADNGDIYSGNFINGNLKEKCKLERKRKKNIWEI